MEFLEGQSLRDIIQMRGALPLHEAINIACQMLDALDHAHRHHVIHRDIKPDNIFILPGGRAKLADFGIARLSEEPSLTSDGQVFGTPSYMSPEQCSGAAPLTPASDVYSVGIILYEMLTGAVPFSAETPLAVALKQVSEPPVPPRKIVPGDE